MEPFEIMVSESQERMLGVVEPAKVAEVLAVCEKWQTGAAEIGVVTDTGAIRILRGEDVVGEMPVEALVDGCPLYDLEPAAPEGWIYGNRVTLEEGASAEETLLALLASPSIASKRWAFEQYDSVVGSRTARRPESADAAVLATPEAECGAIAVSIDGNGRRVACDPHAGTIEAVLECVQNLACVGAEPLGVTNCLNFGNPEKPTGAWQLDRAVSGLAEACEALGLPVVGGNVSLYNEGPQGPIYPTPVIGIVGELPDPARRRRQLLRRRGRRDRPRRPVHPHLRRLGAGEAARRARDRAAGARHRRGRRRLREYPRGGPRRPARLRPRHQRRRPRLRPGRVRDRRRNRLRGRPATAARPGLLAGGGPVRGGERRLPGQRRARRPRCAGRGPPRQGRRRRDRDRRRRPQHRRRPRDGGARLALAVGPLGHLTEGGETVAQVPAGSVEERRYGRIG